MRYPKSRSNTFLRVGFISLFLLCSTMLQAQSVSAGLDWWEGYFFSHHHEDGEKGGQSGFSLWSDSGNTIEVQTIKLFYVVDINNEIPVPMKEGKYGKWLKYIIFEGSYDTTSSQWEYYEEFLAGEYYIYFSSHLMEGDYPSAGLYHLQVAGKEGEEDFEYNAEQYYSGPTEVPVISSKSFRGGFDEAGNFIWTWDVPITQEVKTSAKPSICVLGDEKIGVAEVALSQPTHVGMMFVPELIFQRLQGMDGEMTVGLYIKDIEGRSRFRSKRIAIKKLKELKSKIKK